MDDDQVTPAPGALAGEAAELQERMIAFVRGFGLLRPDTTPCGQPLSASEAHALLELSRDAGLAQGELGGRLSLEKSTVSRLAAELERKGWVVRCRDDGDARVIRLRLTPQGQRMAEQVARARAARFREIFDRIPPSERNEVLHALGVLTRAVRRDGAIGEP